MWLLFSRSVMSNSLRPHELQHIRLPCPSLSPSEWNESRSLMSNSLQLHGLYSPWNSLGQDTGVGSLSLLQGNFSTQGSNPGHLHCRQILYQLSHKGTPRILPEFAQTHVHQVSDASQPSHPLSCPSPPAFNLSQHQGLFQWVSSSHHVAKVLELQLQHQSLQWIFMVDFL